MKISKITSLVSCFLFLLSCNTQEQIDNLQNQINELNNARIASIDAQIEQISSTIACMGKLDTELQTLIQELADSDKSLSREITSLRESLALVELSLGERIDELETYVSDELLNEKDWVKATFSTLEQYQTTLTELAIIKQNVTNLQENMSQSINAAISDSEKTLKSWVNNQLTAYYTIAEIDSKVLLLTSSIKEGDDTLAGKWQDLKEELTITKDNIKIAYEKAIKDAITQSEGVLTAEIQSEIKTATDSLQSEINILWDKLSDIESRISSIESRLEEMEKIIEGISSLIYVPSYSDNRCVMWYGRNMQGEVVGDRDTLSFEVSPTGTAAQLLASADVKFEAQAVYNTVVKSSAEKVELPVLEKYGDGEILTIVVSGEKMKDSFFLGNEGASCRIIIKADNAETISDYIQMRPSAIEYKAYFSSQLISVDIGRTVIPEIITSPTPSPLTFTSSDTNIFTVNDGGTIVGVGSGTAFLTMTTISGFSQTVTVVCNPVDSVTPTDLSVKGTANCYLVSSAGDYKFPAVRGNTDNAVDDIKGVEVLWESFGTDVAPNEGDLIASVSYKNGWVHFSTIADFNDGNAVIAVRNSEGTILWSWHIWLSSEGWKEQIYFNDAGTMMDRNLGALSAIPGEASSNGLMYQWGRKDPFLGASSVSSNTQALSTGTWTKSSGGSIALAQENPMTFYRSSSLPIGSWDSKKTAYDPCPAGWRVPDGDSEGVWAKASGKSEEFDLTSESYGPNFSGIFGADTDIWYPLSGHLDFDSFTLTYVGSLFDCWSVSLSANGLNASSFYFYDGHVSPAIYSNSMYGCTVRCLQE